MTGINKDPVKLWQELRERKVVRVMTVYIAGAFAILQAVDIIFPRIGLPPWTISLSILILSAGLVVSVILAWIYEITPEGIKRTGTYTGVNEEEPRLLDHSQWETSISGSPGEVLSYNAGIYSRRAVESKKKDRVYSYSSGVVIVAVLMLFTFSSSSTVPFRQRDWILITDFENLTGDPVYDKSLYTAFLLTASQSRYINILPRSRMLETMERMEITGSVTVNDVTGREIAIREGIDLFVVPGINSTGNKFLLSARIINSSNGEILRAETVYAESQDEILEKLDFLSRRIRRHLGESRYRIAVQDKPLKQVTTSSLEALKLYSQGIDHHLMLDFEGAREYYQNALMIDPGFTSAKASLGNLLIERFDPVKGRELLSEAAASVDKLTERERLGILAFHAVSVERDLPKAIEFTKMRISLYPDDAAAHNNLGWYYQNQAEYTKALEEYKKTVKVFPDMALTYGGINWVYLEKLGYVDSAIIWSERMIKDNPDNAYGYVYLASAMFCLDSLEKALGLYLRARDLSPGLKFNLYRLAHTYRTCGLYQDAIKTLREVLSADTTEYVAWSDIGLNYSALGLKVDAERCFKKFRKYATGIWLKEYPAMADTYTAIASVTARLGEKDYSRENLEKALSIDSSKHIEAAAVLVLLGDTAGALTQVENALKAGYRDLTWIKMHPDLQHLNNQSRFRQLLNDYFFEKSSGN